MAAPNGLTLAVDTATPMESVALLLDGEPIVERCAFRPRGHGPWLLDAIDGVLVEAGRTLADLDALVCGLGPGSFTGQRIALATLKGLALAYGAPLWGVRTTAALIAAAPGRRVVAVIDARRKEVFVDAAELPAPRCCAPAAVAGLIGPGERPLLLGSGARLYSRELRDALPGADLPDNPVLHHPRAALLAGAVDPSRSDALATLEPIYVRRSDAEINYPQGFPDATAVPPQRHPGRH